MILLKTLFKKTPLYSLLIFWRKKNAIQKENEYQKQNKSEITFWVCELVGTVYILDLPFPYKLRLQNKEGRK